MAPPCQTDEEVGVGSIASQGSLRSNGTLVPSCSDCTRTVLPQCPREQRDEADQLVPTSDFVRIAAALERSSAAPPAWHLSSVSELRTEAYDPRHCSLRRHTQCTQHFAVV